ncbi:MAG: ATP-binding protein [Anaerolineae bacterium]|nr:ATP-binding protein [Anaerolineae bacterium]
MAIIARRLGESDIFADVEPTDLLTIAECGREIELPEGFLIIAEGEPADRLFVVLRGRVALEKRVQLSAQSTPRSATLDYVGPGQVTGVSALTSPFRYSTSAVTVEPTRGILIDAAPLRLHLQANPGVGLTVMSTLATLLGQRYRSSTYTLTYFLSIVSHELRSPLAAIESYLQTMLDGFAGAFSAKQEKMLQRCALRVKDMRALIGDVVDLARMRREQIQADFEWFNPGEAGAESIEDVSLAAAEKGVKIKVEPAHDFQPVVGARRRFRQVLTNLLANAIKFSPEGATVRFRAWYEPDAVYFQVEDAGPGIPPDELDHIFQDFYRGSNVAGQPGTGLGLSIAKLIMDAHEGEIKVESVASGERTGTCFTVILPRTLKTPEIKRQEWTAG